MVGKTSDITSVNNTVNNVEDEFVNNFLSELPQGLRESYSDAQLEGIKKVFEKKEWALHPMDVRTSVGFWRWRFYFVFLAGRDRRKLSARRYRFLRATVISFMLFYVISSTLLGILALYLLKSALGYDIFSGFSFGVWGWFKALTCG